MKNNKENLIIYSFICPPPCNREIMVEAKNNLEAIDKILMEGAISCRNSGNRSTCEKAHFNMPPIPIEQLKDIVGLYMREECEA
jgi:transcription elongation factor Elf1